MMDWRYVRPRYASRGSTAEDKKISGQAWTPWAHAGVLRSCWLNSKLLTPMVLTAFAELNHEVDSW